MKRSTSMPEDNIDPELDDMNALATVERKRMGRPRAKHIVLFAIVAVGIAFLIWLALR